MKKLIIFDCDSTLSAIEGIDELARACPTPVHAAIEAMTREAMEGSIKLDEVFERRLALIRPTREAVAALARQYVETIAPNAKLCVRALQSAGWECAILSGGIRQAILPLAEHLGIKEVEAVDLIFSESGEYLDFDRAFPTTRSGGKPEFVRALRAREKMRIFIVMVGDGVSDLETQSEVDLFAGYGGFVAREKVRSEAAAFVTDFAELAPLLAAH